MTKAARQRTNELQKEHCSTGKGAISGPHSQQTTAANSREGQRKGELSEFSEREKGNSQRGSANSPKGQRKACKGGSHPAMLCPPDESARRQPDGGTVRAQNQAVLCVPP